MTKPVIIAEIGCNKFRQEKIDFLPILDSDMRLINIITKKQFHIVLLENIKFDLKRDFLI